MQENDWFGLIYSPKRSNIVLDETNVFFKNNPKIKEKYYVLSMAYQSIWKIIPQTVENFWSGHIFPHVESWDELQISFNLALFGLYKQAFVSLRSGLESGMLSVYYNINDEGHKTVQDWLKSKDNWEANTPRAKKIWEILNSNNNISKFNKMHDLKNDFDDLNFLHNYVHTKGAKYSNSYHSGSISNFQTFQEKMLLKWLDTYEKIIILLITLHMLKYPISTIEFSWSKKTGIDNPYPVLEIPEIETIASLLPKTFIAKIKDIAKKDQHTQELFHYIVSLPDMTKEEKEIQIINLDKTMIQGQGFLKWEKQELSMMETLNSTKEDKQNTLKRIQILKKWSIDNNLMN